MKGLVSMRSLVLLVAGVVAIGTLASVDAPRPPATSDASMGIWEAATRGYVSIVMVNETFQEDGVTVTLPVGIRVTNTASVPVVIPEEVVLMSPHPAQSPPPNPANTTADAVLTNGTVPAQGSLLYSFGEYVLAGYLTGPLWWDIEEMQFSKAGVAFQIGGEVLPFALRSMIEHPYYNGADNNTQIALWSYLRSYATVVVGKLPLWSTVNGDAGKTIRVRIDATNKAVWATDDTETRDVNVTNGIIADDVPAGWSVEAGSYSVPPDLSVNHTDGSQTLEWNETLPAAQVSYQGNPALPTPYTTVTRSYTLVAPALPNGTVSLPRARSDMNRTGVPDAHSAPVLVNVTGNLPPNADAGGPYTGNEGDTILLNAAHSSDPDGDPLQFRWSFTDNGTWDTAWSASPTASVTYTDEFSGNVRVEVTDGHTAATATAAVTIQNVAPTIGGLAVTSTVPLEFRLRIAGEKGHDATLTVQGNGTTAATVRVLRQPGDPETQAGSSGVLFLNVTKPVSATVTYTPADDPVNGNPNGATPAWLSVVLPNGTAVTFFHNFNVRHKDTWTWRLGDLRNRLDLRGTILVAHVHDPGADTLTVHWDFGDGTNATQVFPNGPAGDAPESPVGGAAPMDVIAMVAHRFPGDGPYTVTITVTDGDGASATAALVVSP